MPRVSATSCGSVASTLSVVATLELARAGGDPVLPGARNPPADPVLGRHDPRGARLPGLGVVDRICPGIVLMLTSIVVSRTGDCLRDFLDPTLTVLTSRTTRCAGPRTGGGPRGRVEALTRASRRGSRARQPSAPRARATHAGSPMRHQRSRALRGAARGATPRRRSRRGLRAGPARASWPAPAAGPSSRPSARSPSAIRLARGAMPRCSRPSSSTIRGPQPSTWVRAGSGSSRSCVRSSSNDDAVIRSDTASSR